MSYNSRKRSHDAIDSENDERKMPAVEKEIKMSDTVKKPKVGMLLEARDSEYIWSPARVVKVDKTGGIRHVTLHYPGWNESCDESIPWKSERLAPLYSFTKQVKCLVNLMHKSKVPPSRQALNALPPGAKRGHCNLWPCTVQLRMPHPLVEGLEDEKDCLDAEAKLRGQVSVFIQPYASHLLPPAVRSSDTLDGGRWVNANRLRPWPNDPLKLGVLPNNFEEAFEIAENDTDVVGVLPARPFELGSMLKPTLRVHTRAGAQVRDGSLQEVFELPKHLQDESDESLEVEVVEVRHEQEEHVPNEGYNLRTTPAMPPKLPPPIEITDLIYSGCGVKRCQWTNQWTASICIAGNELFLGSFPTQTQAYQATRVAVGDNTVEVETNLQKARLADLRAVPIEAVIEATEKTYDPSVHSFSLQQYAVEQIRYEAYQDQINTQGEAEGVASESQPPVAAVEPPRRNKRKGRPRKVDLERRCYI